MSPQLHRYPPVTASRQWGGNRDQVLRMRRKDSTVRGRYDLWLWLLEMRWPLQGATVAGERTGEGQGHSGEVEGALDTGACGAGCK